MPRVIHFEIGIDDPERAIKFYQEVFGWKIVKWEGPTDYWLITTGDDDQPGINGALMRRTDSENTTNTIDVPNIDEYIENIIKAGGKVVAPKMVVPGVGYAAYCEDTEGNRFGLMQDDPSAK